MPLTEKGQMQAQKLAEKVVDLPVPITKIIHSPLQRARDTAQAVADRLSLPLTVDERLVEMDFGDYDGLPSKDELSKSTFSIRCTIPKWAMKSQTCMHAWFLYLNKPTFEQLENVYLLICHNALIRVYDVLFI